ncbi:MAG: autotransporter-associated beta strand repeat-containing protein [Verrucomicrobia bacterium]|nr:autotransporter-associated beta strand repeat-containing protein [Verrucomicrobiota bacterium]
MTTRLSQPQDRSALRALALVRELGVALCLLFCLVPAGSAQTTLYWDINGATAGAGGATPSGTWNTAGAANWSTSSAGNVATANWTAGSHSVFSAGTDATGSYTVTLGGGMSVANMNFEEGTALVTANTLTLSGAGGSTIDVASGRTAQIDSLLAGSAALIKTGTGTLILGSNTFNSHSGAVTINAGVLESAKTDAVGAIHNAAAVTVASGATLRFNGNALYNIETIGSLSGAGSVQHTGLANFTFKIDGAASTTFSGVISDGAQNLNLEKNTGTGTLTLSGANTYDGTTTINAGAINIQNATALGSTTGGTTVASGAALQVQGGIAVGAEALTLSGTGISNTGALRNISGNNSFAGNIVLAATSEIQSDAGTLSLTGTINGNAASRGLRFDGSGNTTVSNSIGANVSTLTKAGTGTLTLTGSNSYTGATAVQAGTLSFNSIGNVSGGASALGAPTTVANGTIALGSGANTGTLAYTGPGNTTNRVINLAGTTGGGTIDASGSGALVFTSALTATGGGSKTLTLTGSSTAANTLSGAIVNNSGTNLTSVVKSGSGTWVLSGANTYTGTTAINGGTLRIDADNRLGTAPGSATANKLTFDGGTLETTANFTLNANRGTTINAGGGTFDVNSGTTLTYNGILAGTGTLTKTDSGTLILGGSAANTHSGSVDVNAGTLQIAKTGGASAIGDSAAVTVASGANLRFSGGSSETIGSLAGGGTVDNTSGSAITLTTGGSNASTTFSGVIQNTGGALGLTKTGTGTLTLSGTSANTFTGAVSVANGTLELGKTGGVNAIGGNTLTIGDGVGAASSAGVTLLAYQQIPDTAAVTINSDGVLALNNFSEKVDTISGLGLIDLSTSGFLTVGTSGGSSSFSGSVSGTGTLIKEGAGSLTFNSNINFGGTLTLSGGTLALNGTSLTVNTLRITGNTILDFGLSTASILTAANVIIDAGATLTVTNWVHLQDYFYATSTFTQFGGPSATFDVRGVAPQNQVAFTGFSNNYTTWASHDRQITPAPEPATYGAAFAGLSAGLVLWRRRRRA